MRAALRPSRFLLLPLVLGLAACGGPEGLEPSDQSGEEDPTLGRIGGVGSDSNQGFRCASDPCEVLWLADVGGSREGVTVAAGWVYFVRDEQLSRVPLDGGAPPARVVGVQWGLAGDGQRVYTVGNNYPWRVIRVDAATGGYETLNIPAKFGVALNSQALFAQEDRLVYRWPLDGSARVVVGSGGGHSLTASERWVCWTDVAEFAECAFAQGTGDFTAVDNVAGIFDVDESHLYYIDRDYNLRRAALPGGKSELVWGNGEGPNLLGSHADARHLYWMQARAAGGEELGQRHILRLEKSTGTIELFGTMDTGGVMGGNEEFLFVSSPLRRIRK